MASKKNTGMSEKIQDIKRMQKNWMDQRASFSSAEKKDPSGSRPTFTETDMKKSSKQTDIVSWVVGGGTKRKPTSVRARSASPSRPSHPPPASGRNTSKFSSGKPGAPSQPTGARATTSGRPPVSGRSSSSRSDSGSARKPPSPGDPDSLVFKGRMRHSGSEPNLNHRVDPEAFTTNAGDPSSQRTDPSSASRQCTDQGSFRDDRNSSQIRLLNDDKATRPVDSGHPTNNQSGSIEQAVSHFHGDRPELQTRDVMPPGEFDKLANQIASKVRADLMQERNEIMRSVGFSGKSVLDDDDGNAATLPSHKCSKCNQVMISPDHAPYILIPCGHTLCEPCAEDRIKCSICRAKAPNTALQQIIQTESSGNHGAVDTPGYPTTTTGYTYPQRYNPKEYTNPTMDKSPDSKARHTGPHLLDDNDDIGGSGYSYGGLRKTQPRSERGVRKLSPQEQAEKYLTEYQNLVIRCEAMDGEEEEVLAAMERKNRDITKQKKQIHSIMAEQDRQREEIRKMEERIRTLEEHRREYEHQCEELEDDKREGMEKLTLIRDMRRGLERNKEKIKLLARNYNVSLD